MTITLHLGHMGQKMATGSVLSPSAGVKHQATSFETQSRLEKCWRVDVNWSYYPDVIHQVSAKLVLDSDPACASTLCAKSYITQL